jgi:hypothetical protein
MNFRGKKHISLVSGFFLASFLGALTLSALCELEIVKFAGTDIDHHEELSQNLIGDIQQGTDHNSHADAENFRSSNKNKTQNSAGDECCSEEAGTLESSLFSDVSKIKIPPAKFFVAGIIETAVFAVPIYHFKNSIFHEYDDPPPLNGFKLRVVIQSFLT